MVRRRIDVPVADGESREQTHLHLNLRGEESLCFHAVRRGLLDEGAKLADGRPVWSCADVIRWLIQKCQ